MGLKKRSTGSGKQIVVVKHGGLCTESKEPREGFEKKEVPNPSSGGTVTKYLKLYDSLSGRITELEWYDTEAEYATRFLGLKIHLEDEDGDSFILNLPYDKAAFTTFTKIAENIDYTKPIEFVTWPDRMKKLPDGSPQTVFGAMQDGNPVRHRYTKDNPGDCPPPIQNARTKRWNFDAQKEWLLANLLDNIIPAANAAAGAAVTHTGEDDRWADAEDALHDTATA